MTKRCPIMSKQNESHSKIYCFENECAWWDEKMKMCCIKSAMIAVAGKKDGGSGSIPLQAGYVYPTRAIISSGSGDWVNPHTYTITCDSGGTT